MKRTRNVTVICILVIGILISSCGAGQLPEPTSVPTVSIGTIRGTLIDKDNLPYKNAQVILCTTEGDKALIFGHDGAFTSADENGVFTFTNMPSGKYCLLVFDGQTAATDVVLTRENQIFTFDVPNTAGIDLGEVSVENRKLLSD